MSALYLFYDNRLAYAISTFAALSIMGTLVNRYYTKRQSYTCSYGIKRLTTVTIIFNVLFFIILCICKDWFREQIYSKYIVFGVVFLLGILYLCVMLNLKKKN